MTTSRNGLFKNIDWALVLCYLVLIVIGWINIYASIHSSEPSSIFDPSGRSGKQFIWMGNFTLTFTLVDSGNTGRRDLYTNHSIK